ncbi:MAG: hypothetical protein WDN31_21635 [Hyphomicrobium sp.]
MIDRPEVVPLRHVLLAVAIMAVWGTNFVVIRIGLDHLPPLLFAALRFSLALFRPCCSSGGRRCRGATSPPMACSSALPSSG